MAEGQSISLVEATFVGLSRALGHRQPFSIYSLSVRLALIPLRQPVIVDEYKDDQNPPRVHDVLSWLMAVPE